MENYNNYIKNNWFKITNELGKQFDNGINEDLPFEIILDEVFEDFNLDLDICINLLRLALNYSIPFNITYVRYKYDSGIAIRIDQENSEYFYAVVEILKHTIEEMLNDSQLNALENQSPEC